MLWIASNSILLLSNDLICYFFNFIFLQVPTDGFLYLFPDTLSISMYLVACVAYFVHFLIQWFVLWLKKITFTHYENPSISFSISYVICTVHRPCKLSIIMIKPSKFTMYWTQITPDTFTCHTKNYICNIEKMVQVLSIGTSNHRDHIKISIYIKLIFLWMSY